MINEQRLLVDLQDFAEELGHSPSAKEMNNKGPHSVGTYQRRFGSWAEAKKEADLEIAKCGRHYSKEDLIAHLCDLADELGRSPSVNDMQEHGKHSVETYARNFGSWLRAKKEADLGRTPSNTSVSHSELLSALSEFADELGHAPSVKEMDEHGPYSVSTYIRVIGSWTEAKTQVGLEKCDTASIEYSDDELLEAIRNLPVNGVPRQKDMDQYGDPSAFTICKRFGDWNTALEQAGYEPQHLRDIPREDLVDDIEQVVNNCGTPVTQSDYKKHGNYSIGALKNEFGSWGTAVNHVGYSVGKENKYSKEIFKQLLRDLSTGGVAPGPKKFENKTGLLVSNVQVYFGSWTAAIEEAGLTPKGRPTGEEHPMWSGGYSNCYGPGWTEQRRKALQRDEYKCQRCGITNEKHLEEFDEELHVHHKIRFNDFDDHEQANRLSNLITLCQSCHSKVERWPVQPLQPEVSE